MTHIYIFHILFHFSLLQDIEYSSLFIQQVLLFILHIQFSSVQSLSRVRLFAREAWCAAIYGVFFIMGLIPG